MLDDQELTELLADIRGGSFQDWSPDRWPWVTECTRRVDGLRRIVGEASSEWKDTVISLVSSSSSRHVLLGHAIGGQLIRDFPEVRALADRARQHSADNPLLWVSLPHRLMEDDEWLYQHRSRFADYVRTNPLEASSVLHRRFGDDANLVDFLEERLDDLFNASPTTVNNPLSFFVYALYLGLVLQDHQRKHARNLGAYSNRGDDFFTEVASEVLGRLETPETTSHEPGELYDLIYAPGQGDISIVQSLLARLPERRAVLELGCGTGRLLIPAAEEYPHLWFTGLDIDAHFLERCQKKIQRSPRARQAMAEGRLKLVLGDMTRLNAAGFNTDRFDVIFLAVSSIVHVAPDELPALFTGVSHLLKEGGSFYADLTDAALRPLVDKHNNGRSHRERRRESRRDHRPPYDLYELDETGHGRIKRTFRFHFTDRDRNESLQFNGHLHTHEEIEHSADAAGLRRVKKVTTQPDGSRSRTSWIFRKYQVRESVSGQESTSC